MTAFNNKLQKVRTLIFDVDGIFTDGTFLVVANDEQVRKMYVRDGYAVHHAIKNNYHIAIISGGHGESVRQRFQGLGVTDIFLGVSDKIIVLNQFLSENGLHADEVLYMGDDIPDYLVMQKVGMAACPADAAEEIIGISHYISPKNGGQGCVRDIIEMVMKAQGKWMNDDAFTW